MGSDKISQLQEENEDSQEVKTAVEELVARMDAELDMIEKFLFKPDPLTGKLYAKKHPSRDDWRHANLHVEKLHRIAVGCHQ